MRTAQVVSGLALLCIARAAFAQDAWAAADIAVVRLAPSAFKMLPVVVREDLERRGCRIPQVIDERTATNVVTGDFLGSTKKDWAVLCSVNRISRVLVYSGESSSAVDSLDARPDKSFLQEVGGGRIGFSRMITTATTRRVRRAAARYKDQPLSVPHDGIEIAFVDKASSIFYWNGKRWIELVGSD